MLWYVRCTKEGADLLAVRERWSPCFLMGASVLTKEIQTLYRRWCSFIPGFATRKLFRPSFVECDSSCMYLFVWANRNKLQPPVSSKLLSIEEFYVLILWAVSHNLDSRSWSVRRPSHDDKPIYWGSTGIVGAQWTYGKDIRAACGFRSLAPCPWYSVRCFTRWVQALRPWMSGRDSGFRLLSQFLVCHLYTKSTKIISLRSRNTFHHF